MEPVRDYSGWGFWILVILAFVFWGDIWYSKLAYAMSYNVSRGHVYIDWKPHDCDFWKAPIGEKECHYKRVVNTVEKATSKEKLPIMSFDSGKTWVVYAPDPGSRVPESPTVESVHIRWERVED